MSETEVPITFRKFIDNLEANGIQHKKTNFQHFISNMRIENKKNVECQCGSVISRGNISKHFETDKHQAFLETQN